MDYKHLEGIQTYFHKQNLHLCKNSDSNSSNDYKILERDTINLLSYNVFQVPRVASLFHPAPHPEERLLGLTNILKDYDILCFQECWGFCQERKEKIILMAQKAGYFFFRESPAPGLLTSFIGDGDALTERGTLYVKIKLGLDNYVNIFNLHTNSSTAFPFPRIMKQTVECRQDQIKQMINFVDSVISKDNMRDANASNMYLIVGDFNLSAIPIDQKLKDMILKFRPDYGYLVDIFDGEFNQMMTYMTKQDVQIEVNEDTDRYANIQYANMNVRDNENIHKVINYGYLHNDNQHPGTMVGGQPVSRVNKSKGGLNMNGQTFKMCIDYIIEKRILFNGQEKSARAHVVEGSCKVIEFSNNDQKLPYNKLSDHFGLCLEIRVDQDENAIGQKTI
ncbi:UNKNOWN [Stylonychia lemnae]|uniref:Endonuclease/exonuclease/phosphatase domain-containing protein n=1 Tax=Stylonychia lemnae TaxID=5949 RepID=A0A078AG55_STYLE|nr:UNKNOWN [Stylonychia lemnae]|eukprot:CDW81290.1 UNKNOWN [Stylonychia lemnae]